MQNGPEHALVVASTQSGKTSCFVIPNLLTWEESMLVHDPKEELHTATAGWRSTFSRVVQLAPTSSRSACFNPLEAIRLGTDYEIRDAQLVSECLTDPEAQGSDKRSSASQHFVEMGAEAIGGLILYGLYTQRARSLGALNALVTHQGFKAHPEGHAALSAFWHPAGGLGGHAGRMAGMRAAASSRRPHARCGSTPIRWWPG